jgi:hypothetical protein
MCTYWILKNRPIVREELSKQGAGFGNLNLVFLLVLQNLTAGANRAEEMEFRYGVV